MHKSITTRAITILTEKMYVCNNFNGMQHESTILPQFGLDLAFMGMLLLDNLLVLLNLSKLKTTFLDSLYKSAYKEL